MDGKMRYGALKSNQLPSIGQNKLALEIQTQKIRLILINAESFY